MQEMLEWTRNTFPMDLDTPRMIEDKIESLLEKEKEQIVNDYGKGKVDLFMFYKDLGPDKTAEEYYNQTYNQDRELPKDVKDMLNNL